VDAFTLWIGAGVVLGLVQVARFAPREALLAWLDAALLVLFGALAGARLYFVFIHVEYFRSHPLEIPQIWLGGLDWPGAVLGGVFFFLGIVAVKDLALAQAADRLAHLVPPLAIAAWLASGAAGTDYALPASWSGVISGQFPVPLIGALSLLCYYAWLEIRVTHPLAAGRRAGYIGLGLAVNLLGFSFLRSDPYPLWLGYRPDTWAAAAAAIILLVICLLPNRTAQPDREISDSIHSRIVKKELKR
jgi:hypothetical protein